MTRLSVQPRCFAHRIAVTDRMRPRGLRSRMMQWPRKTKPSFTFATWVLYIFSDVNKSCIPAMMRGCKTPIMKVTCTIEGLAALEVPEPTTSEWLERLQNAMTHA